MWNKDKIFCPTYIFGGNTRNFYYLDDLLFYKFVFVSLSIMHITLSPANFDIHLM